MFNVDDISSNYIRRQINKETFFEIFKPNGSGPDFRYYFCEPDDIEFFAKAYIEDDPRFYDYGPDEEKEDNLIENEDILEDEYEDEEVDYRELPHPEISIFIKLATNEFSKEIIEKISVCKIYQTGCFTAGAQSSILTIAEAEWIARKMDRVVL